jgi:NAD(P)-dependent dehydrogenase (short-subunit alcohol dehydrogenase family)
MSTERPLVEHPIAERPVVLVTAASQGIGRAIATHLARDCRVVLLARSPEIVEIAELLGGHGVQGSLTDPRSLERFVSAAIERYGRIDALVNNTGHPPQGDLLTLTDSDWQQGFDLVLNSVIRLHRLVLPGMVERRRGAIINISSYAAQKPELERPLSSVFRAALSAWTKLQAEFGAPHGIRVNSVLPGFVDSYPVAQKMLDTIPLGRPGRLDELAKYVAFLLSEDANYITGQNLLFDGGMLRGL